jgi:hypothetical protein
MVELDRIYRFRPMVTTRPCQSATFHAFARPFVCIKWAEHLFGASFSECYCGSFSGPPACVSRIFAQQQGFNDYELLVCFIRTSGC